MQQALPVTPIKDLTDAELAGRIASGDMLALQHLMRRHNQTLYRTARSILKDDAEAEDAVQEAYVLAYRAMDRFRGDARLSTWLIRIAVNVAIRRARKLNRSAEVRTRYFRAKGLLREALASEIDFSLGEAFSFASDRCDRIVAGVLSRLANPQA